jgi:hypothetical protein
LPALGIFAGWLTSLVACHDDFRPPTDPVGRWLYERGAAEGGIDSCLRMAAALRAECKGNAPCERTVSEDISFKCYAGSYRGSALARESPCVFLSEDDNKGQRAKCVSLKLDPKLVPHCEAELHIYAHDLCRRGDPTLTGAGP